MTKLTPEKRAELEALLAADDDADDDDFEVEIQDGDKRARVPYSKGRSWLQTAFGIDLDPEPEEEPEEPAKGGKLKAAPEPRRFGGRRVS